jgi:tRNA pseudouridine synthase 10
MTLLEKARRVLEQNVCDSCLGRQFGQLLSGHTNAGRGRALRILAAMSIDKEKLADEDNKIDLSNFAGMKFHNLESEKIIPKETKECSLCSGVFGRLDKLALRAFNAVKDIEFRTFVGGSKLSASLLDAEEELWERAGIDWAEPLKAELNRELGKRIEALFVKAKINAEFEPQTP